MIRMSTTQMNRKKPSATAVLVVTVKLPNGGMNQYQADRPDSAAQRMPGQVPARKAVRMIAGKKVR